MADGRCPDADLSHSSCGDCRFARSNYEITKTFEAGINLVGTEVVRGHACSFDVVGRTSDASSGAWCRVLSAVGHARCATRTVA